MGSEKSEALPDTPIGGFVPLPTGSSHGLDKYPYKVCVNYKVNQIQHVCVCVLE